MAQKSDNNFKREIAGYIKMPRPSSPAKMIGIALIEGMKSAYWIGFYAVLWE